jgi:hypothetical protein
LFRAGLYAQAAETFAKAYSYVRLPSIGLWQARTLAKLGRHTEALELLRDVAQVTLSRSEPASEKKAQADAAAELQVVLRQFPSLTIQVKGATQSDVKVSLDGQPLSTDLLSKPQRVNPGSHHLEALRLSDHMSTQSDIEIKLSEQSTVVLQFVGALPSAGPLPAPVPYTTKGTAGTVTAANPGQTTTASVDAMPSPWDKSAAENGPGHPPSGAAAPATQRDSVAMSLGAASPPPQFQAPIQQAADAKARQLVMPGGLLPLTIEPDSRATAPAAPAASSKRSKTATTVGEASLGTGIASLLVGIGSYAVALEKKGTLNNSPNCTDYRCNTLERSNVDSYNQFRTVGIVSLLGGGALVATGLITLYYPNKQQPERKVALQVGPLSARFVGAF